MNLLRRMVRAMRRALCPLTGHVWERGVAYHTRLGGGYCTTVEGCSRPGCLAQRPTAAGRALRHHYDGSLSEYQRQVEAWHVASFGEDVPTWRPMLKLVEEVGEMARAVMLGRADLLRPEIGDVLVTLLGVGARAGIDVEAAFKEKWSVVRARSPERVREEHR